MLGSGETKTSATAPTSQPLRTRKHTDAKNTTQPNGPFSDAHISFNTGSEI
jgi:hypothetical protein